MAAGNGKEKVYLIDGSGYIFRAFYATPHLSNSQGFPTNALYGFTRMLLSFLKQCDSCYVAVAFDAGKVTFRNELYSEYKANRREPPSELAQQLPLFQELTSTLGMPVLALPGWEADDVIGTLAHRLEQEGREVVIVSADKDLCQLVTENVSIWDTMRDRWFRRAEVIEKFGVAPEKMVEYLALAGDSSDNIPGLRGAGPKTAAQLIETYGDVENIISSCAEILEDKSIRSRKKLSAQIESDPEMIRLSRRLVEVAKDAPVEVRTPKGSVEAISELDAEQIVHSLVRHDVVEPQFSELMRRLEFESLAKEFQIHGRVGGKRAEEDGPLNGARYHLVTPEQFPELCERLKNCTSFCFDTETSSLDIREARLAGVAFCFSDEEAFYVPIDHRAPAEELIALEVFRESLNEIFASDTIAKIGQNLKYDIGVLEEHGFVIRGALSDTMIAAYLRHPDRGGYGLTQLAKERLGYTMVDFSELGIGGGDFRDVPLDRATRYAAEDAHVTWLLWKELQRELEQEELVKLFQSIEMPLVPILSRMERRGVNIDLDFLRNYSKELEQKLAHLEEQIVAAAGVKFNLNSPKQLSEVLFGTLQISSKGIKKTKTGYSTNQAILEKLEHLHPVPRLILEYRGLHKLKSTYVDALPEQVSPKTGRLHTSFNQTVTATGRLSSSQPNLQNIPIQTEAGRRVREAFVAKPERVLISADYSQIELRILAHLSGDANLIEAFRSGEDIHSKTAREVLKLADGSELSPQERRIGKTINFGIVYGMSGFRLARDLGIPVKEANDYIHGYFAKYPLVKVFFEELESKVDRGEPVTTFFGRKRFVQEIDSSGRDQGFVQRAALNAPIQGSAADVIKLAMIALEKRITDEGHPIEMLLQIHDELLFECDQEQVESMCAFVREVMEQVVSLDVPLEVDVRSGHSWEEAH